MHWDTLPMSNQARPIGLRPAWVAASLRIQEILEAMLKYYDKGWPVPQLWLNELKLQNQWQKELKALVPAGDRLLTPPLPDNQDSYYPCKRMMLQEQPYSDCFPALNCDGCDCWRSSAVPDGDTVTVAAVDVATDRSEHEIEGWNGDQTVPDTDT